MRTGVHPGLFLGISIAVSAAVLWVRSQDNDAPVTLPVQPGAPAPQAAARESVQLDAATLQRHAGRYDLDGTIVEIAVDDGALVADGGPAGTLRLLAASETQFFVAGFPSDITFGGDDGGRSARFVVDLPSGRFTARRLPDQH
jgi:hypothetical protein